MKKEDSKRSSITTKLSFDDKENETSSRFTVLINRIGESVSESETLFEFIKKVFHIMFYTRLMMSIIIVYLIFHIAIAFNGIDYFFGI
jgi:hypothetical protein